MKSESENTRVMLITPFYLPSVGGVQYILYNVCKRLPPENIIVMRSRDPLNDNATESFNAGRKYRIIENRFYTPSPDPLSDLNAEARKRFAEKSTWNRLFLQSRLVRSSFILLSILTTLWTVRKCKIDVLWCGYMNTRFMAICLMAKYLLGVPYFVHTYGEELPALRRPCSVFHSMLNRVRIMGLKRASGVFTLSSFSRECLLKIGLPGDKIILKNPCVDVEEFREDPAEIGRLREKYDLDGKKIILSVGNITKRKGVDVILKLLPSLIAEVPNLVYMVVGKFIGEEEKNLRRIISENRIEDRVIFPGEVPHDRIAPYFYLCDVFCLATPADQEGFGIVFIEANACKKPVVGVDTGGVGDAIIHGFNGLSVPQGDNRGLQKALLKILTEEGYAEDLGRKGYKRVLKEFSWDKYAEIVRMVFVEDVDDAGRNRYRSVREKGLP